MVRILSLSHSAALVMAVVSSVLCQLITSPETNAVIDSGSFASPSAAVRPQFRYWLPDASVDGDIVAADLEAAAAIGAGGVEFLPFFEYGGQLVGMPAGANWSTYNFGTVPFRELFKRALETHKKHGLKMDFALGPNQGQGVPASSEDEGLQWDLVPFSETVPSDGSFTGIIPGWGQGELVSLVSALVLSNQTMSFLASGNTGEVNVTYDQYILRDGTLVDQSAQVSTTGEVKLSFPEITSGSYYRLFSFYQKLSGNKNLDFTSTRDSTVFDNGSYTVDHFSIGGAQAVARCWEKYILLDGVPELLRDVGNYAWEDSQELLSNVSWSRTFPDKFESKFGYSLKKYLPLFTFRQNDAVSQPALPGPFECLLDTEDSGLGYVHDFSQLLLDGYGEYLEGLKDWAHNTLGVQLSAQPYGLPFDTQAAIPSLDAPECESWGFLDSIDNYRQFSGPANLADKRVISNELGAIRGDAFRYHLSQLLFSVNRGFAGGVNRFVIHGQAYSGAYFGSTWPGSVPFNYLFSEPWSPKVPVWDHGLKEILDYIGRVQYTQQAGVPKVDVAIYNKQAAYTFGTGEIYQSTDLIENGWTYSYLSPNNLELSQAQVKDGILAPNGPAWKAFVVQRDANVTLDTVRFLKTYAAAGLPVIFTGGLPSFYPQGNSTKDEFETEFSVLTGSKNVYSVGSGKVASTLSSLELRPNIAVATNGTWFTTWRVVDGVDYAFVLADLSPSRGNITIVSAQAPFFLNPWTGESSPVLVYERIDDTVTIPLSLAGNQTVIIAFGGHASWKSTDSTPKYHVASVPSNVLGSTFNKRGGISLHVSQSTSLATATHLNGTKIALEAASVPALFELQEWSLTVEHWEAPANLSDGGSPPAKLNSTYKLTALAAWADIPMLVNSSGVGYYTTSFSWPPTCSSSKVTDVSGAYIAFGAVSHGIRVKVNGSPLPPLDITNAVADISTYLRTGTNTLSVVVPTTYWNYIRTIIGNLTEGYSTPLPVILEGLLATPLAERDTTGLIGPVTVTPFKEVVL